ncbi:MAG: hypothetical protein Q9170_004790 [Blastenia crenularia]
MSPFPFENLPMELQVKIIQEAIPHKGLLPKTSLRLYNRDHKSQYNNFIPGNLFRVNKLISSEAQSMVQKEVSLIIEVNLNVISVLRTEFIDLSEFWSHNELSHIQHFAKLRNFQIRLMVHDKNPWQNVNQECFPQHEYRERMRLICDTLSTFNKDIHRLVIEIPCFCSLTVGYKVSFVQAKLLNLLSPLRQLKVAHAVTFKIMHQNDDENDLRTGVANSMDAAHLVGGLESLYSRLVGEELSVPERIWKNIKTEGREVLSCGGSSAEKRLRRLFQVLNERPGELERDAGRMKLSCLNRLHMHRSICIDELCSCRTNTIDCSAMLQELQGISSGSGLVLHRRQRARYF